MTTKIIKKEYNLPSTTEELAKFILVGRERLTSVRAGIRAINKLNLAADVRKQKLGEAQMLAGALLDAEVRIFEITNLIPKDTANQYKSATLPRGKIAQIKELGFNSKQISQFKLLSENIDIIEQVKAEAEDNDDLPTRTEVLRKIKDNNKEIIKKQEAKDRTKVISNVEIRKGDFKDVLKNVYEIDAIITDPPYPKEFIDCFSDLALYAKTHLKKDGFIAVYSGQYHLPEVIKRLSEHLTYVWTFCLYHKGKSQLVNGVNIMCGWKPVLIFSNGKKKMRFSAYDVLLSEQREKANHDWQQSESGVYNLIDILSKPGDLIVDPFSGAGTFGKVATENGRKFIGAEII